jgi:hypothetical protein
MNHGAGSPTHYRAVFAIALALGSAVLLSAQESGHPSEQSACETHQSMA